MNNKYGNGGEVSDNGSGWTEIDLSGVMKRPCFAYKRGNIVFTSMPPPRDDDKRARSVATTTAAAKCSVQIVDTDISPSGNALTRTDFCEVCCGIRSPSFSRRAHSFTTHFCTRVPAKGNVSTLSPLAQAANSSDSIADPAVTTNSYRSPLKVSVHPVVLYCKE
jgi:hypothetical protein